MRKTFIVLTLTAMMMACSGCDNKEQALPAVESITLSEDSISLNVDQTRTLIYTVSPDDAVPQGEVSWSSDDTSTATVSGGTVTAVAEGTAVITVELDGVSDRCTVTVSSVQVEEITLNCSTLELTVGETFRLEAAVVPDNTGFTLQWESDNSAVATVDQDGNVNAVSEGSAVITATAGECSAACTVTVNPVEVECVSLDVTELTLSVGEEAALTATVLPENAADKTVSWSSDDSGVATVDNGTVTALAPGQTVIRATAGGKSAECNITVKAIEVESVNLSAYECSLSPGDTYTITATVLPEDATDKTVIWSNDNSDIVTVDNGTITALAPGQTVIRATAGGKSAECTVTVTEKGTVKPDWTVGELFDVAGYAKGIVFEATDDHIKIISLDHTFLPWAVNPLITTGYSSTSDEDGTAGNAALAEAEAANSGNFPAWAWCSQKGDGWGLPSYMELQLLYDSLRENIDAALVSNGGQPLPEESWSNAEGGVFGDTYAWIYGSIYSIKEKTANTGTVAVLRIKL